MKTSVVLKWMAAGCLLVGASTTSAFTPTTNAHVFGEVFVPRDAPIGSQIAQNAAGDLQQSVPWHEGKSIVNEIRIGPRLPAIVAAAYSANSANKGDHLYDSGVPGIGIAIKHDRGNGLCNGGVGSGSMIPSNQKFIPYAGVICQYAGLGSFYINEQMVYLVKTGEIAAGRHTINKEVYQILFDGSAFATGTVSAGVTVTGCNLQEAALTQINVDMGNHHQSVLSLSGVGVTPYVDFTIPFYNCTAGTYPPNTNWNYFTGNYANIKLDPANGSTIFDAARGILNLRPDSTAENVGVQILKNSTWTTAMPLGEEVRLNHVQDGTTFVPLRARYIRLHPAAVNPGTANATANFTVNFK